MRGVVALQVFAISGMSFPRKILGLANRRWQGGLQNARSSRPSDILDFGKIASSASFGPFENAMARGIAKCAE